MWLHCCCAWSSAAGATKPSPPAVNVWPRPLPGHDPQAQPPCRWSLCVIASGRLRPDSFLTVQLGRPRSQPGACLRIRSPWAPDTITLRLSALIPPLYHHHLVSRCSCPPPFVPFSRSLTPPSFQCTFGFHQSMANACLARKHVTAYCIACTQSRFSSEQQQGWPCPRTWPLHAAICRAVMHVMPLTPTSAFPTTCDAWMRDRLGKRRQCPSHPCPCCHAPWRLCLLLPRRLLQPAGGHVLPALQPPSPTDA